MEEKKTSNNVEMKVVAGNDQNEQNEQRLSYDDLNQACAELSQQNQQMQIYIKKLHNKIQQLEEDIMARRLDYLFRVLQYASMFDSDFVGDCAKEIKEALVIPEQPEAEKQK